jgi:hypothetical protein
MLDVCLEAWKISDLSSCKPLGLGIDVWVSVIGLSILGLLALLWRTFWRAVTSVGHVFGFALVWIWHRAFGQGEYEKLCATLRPLVRDNKRIFDSFGPKSGENVDDVRHDLSLWFENRHKIAENNKTIRDGILKDYDKIPLEYRSIFDEWLSHIDAFEVHLKNVTVDYRNNRFPKEVAKIIGADA